jgi:hypothetical protein
MHRLLPHLPDVSVQRHLIRVALLRPILPSALLDQIDDASGCCNESNSISIVPRPTRPADAASPAICTGAKPVGAASRICRRQPKS